MYVIYIYIYCECAGVLIRFCSSMSPLTSTAISGHETVGLEWEGPRGFRAMAAQGKCGLTLLKRTKRHRWRGPRDTGGVAAGKGPLWMRTPQRNMEQYTSKVELLAIIQEQAFEPGHDWRSSSPSKSRGRRRSHSAKLNNARASIRSGV